MPQENRFKLIHTYTGATVAKAKNLKDFRALIDKDQASRYTLHDLKDGSFSGAGIIFKDAEFLNQSSNKEKAKL